MEQINSIGIQRLNDWFANYTSLVNNGNICRHNLNGIKNKKYLSLKLSDIDKLDDAIKFLTDNNIDLQGKSIIVELDEEAYLSKEQCAKLIDIRQQLQDSGATVKVKDGALWSLEDIVSANSHIDDVVKKVNNSTVNENGNNRSLNDMEKFLMVYSFVANRRYQSNMQDIESPRHITSIFKNEDVVCLGFATLLKELCNRVGIECYINHCDVIEKDSGKSYGHANNIVIIGDKPYYCDACFDCIKGNRNERTFNYCLIPYEDTKSLQRLDIVNCSSPFINLNKDKQYIEDVIKEIKQADKITSDQFSKYKNDTFTTYKSFVKKYDEDKTALSQINFAARDYKKEALYYFENMLDVVNKKRLPTPFSLHDYETALSNIYKASGYTEEQANNKVNEIVNINIQRAGADFKQEASNCFAKEYNNGLESINGKN